MIEKHGDPWTPGADAYIITTNGQVNSRGEAVMGAGIAKQAAQRFPQLLIRIGLSLRENGNVANVFPIFSGTDQYVETPELITRIIAMPTKEHWRDPSPLELIYKSAVKVRFFVDVGGFKVVHSVRPGCGLGGRNWETEVKPMLDNIWDDRFVIWSR